MALRRKPGQVVAEEVPPIEEQERIEETSAASVQPETGEVQAAEVADEGEYQNLTCAPTEHHFQTVMLGMEKIQGGRIERYMQGLYCTQCGIGTQYVQYDLYGMGQQEEEPEGPVQ